MAASCDCWPPVGCRGWMLPSSCNIRLQVIRTLMCVLAWPMLNKLGYPITWKEAVVLSWSGLRGAGGPPPVRLRHCPIQKQWLPCRFLRHGHGICVEYPQGVFAACPGSKAPHYKGGFWQACLPFTEKVTGCKSEIQLPCHDCMPKWQDQRCMMKDREGIRGELACLPTSSGM